jgi:PhnB protein
VKNPPPGYHSVSPYLVTEELEALVGFVCDVFEGNDRHRATGAAGRTHVEVEVGDSLVMIGAAGSAEGVRTAMLHVYIDDSAAAYERALEAGATSVMDAHETPFGDRRYAIDDPWGNQWWISTRVRSASPA